MEEDSSLQHLCLYTAVWIKLALTKVVLTQVLPGARVELGGLDS
jgi:hypothetical protein